LLATGYCLMIFRIASAISLIAVAESFFGSLKKERIKKQIYKNRELAAADVADYIVAFYNRSRRHGHLGGVSPEQFEMAHKVGCQGVH